MLFDLVGFTGSGLAHTNWKPFGDNIPERVARLIGTGFGPGRNPRAVISATSVGPGE